MMMKSFRVVVIAMLIAVGVSSFLRGDKADVGEKKMTVRDHVRNLLVDADRSKRCFEDGGNQGLRSPHDADFYENPWKANNDRGDWGKCLPEEVFGVLCEHENAHGVNDGTWMPADGPLHDGPAQELFLKLQQLHNDYCVHVDVNIPDNVQEQFNDFFFARNKYGLSGEELPVSDNTITISVTINSEGKRKYTQNGVQQPVLNMVRGHSYVFDTSDSSNAGHPLSVRISALEPISGVNRVGNPGHTGSATTFLVPMDAPDELEYYCIAHSSMGNKITIVDPVRRLHLDEQGPVTYAMACELEYPDSPRMALQMSLFCLLGYIDQSIDKSLVQKPYGLSPACDVIVRHNMRHQLTQQITFPPHMVCDSDSTANTCTVHADVRTDGLNTCKEYCENFDGLECKAAGVNTWSDQCTELRPWSCTEPAMDSNLMCTCGAKSVPPVIDEEDITTSCAKQLLPSEYRPSRFCSQDHDAGTCTTQTRLNNLPTGTCREYCEKHELSCVNAYDDAWNCIGYKNIGCDSSESSIALCECGPPLSETDSAPNTTPNCDSYCSSMGKICLSASSSLEENCMLANGLPCQKLEDFATQLEYVCGADVQRTDVVEEMSTASCKHMMFYRDPISVPENFCPPNTIESVALLEDTCTVLANVWNIGDSRETRTCDAYCNSFPGMKCVGAAEEVNNDCNVKSILQCNEPYTWSTSDLLCSCAIDEQDMADAKATSLTTLSAACENMLLSPSRDTAKVDRVCESFPDVNTCTVLGYVRDLPTRSCDEFCNSFHEMECVSAAEDKWSSCAEASISSCSAITTSNDLLCTCGFKTGAKRASYLDMAPVFEKNAVRTCPAYETATNNEGNLYYTNENKRNYKMVELTLGINDVDGAAKVTDINVREDRDSSDLDTYNTAHVEACNGFESQIRENDPDEKCSFGHRLDKTQNCYGKVYGQTYDEASAACAERGGHIVRINDAEEYQLLKDIFGDQTFSIGLRDVGGREWEWDRYPGLLENPYNNDYASLSSDEKEDCVQLDLEHNRMTGKYCFERETFMCEGIRDPVTGMGGDLMADEGGFCLWYLDDPKGELPDDESNGFKNTELSYSLLYDEDLRTRKYVEVNNKYYDADNIPGYPPNEANWDDFTYRKLGLQSDEPLIEKFNHNKSYHCHYSPTNFGIARIYIQQHMLERIYPGAMHKHCFCGYKHLGHFVSRCDCTRSGDRNNECQEHHRVQLATETYHQTGEIVYCNNGQCDRPSP